MTLPSSGAITIAQIAAEFGGSTPHSLSEYYRSGGLVPNVSTNLNIPTSGQISLSNFYGATNFSYTTYYNSSGVWTGVSAAAVDTITSSDSSWSPSRNAPATFVVIGGGGSGAVGKLYIPDSSLLYNHPRVNLGGGGSGGMVLKSVPSVSTSQNYNISIPAAAVTNRGAGGEGGTFGTDGGTVTVNGGEVSLSAGGGSKGYFSGSFYQGTGVGGAGGSASGGDVNITGGAGGGDTSNSVAGGVGGAISANGSNNTTSAPSTTAPVNGISSNGYSSLAIGDGHNVVSGLSASNASKGGGSSAGSLYANSFSNYSISRTAGKGVVLVIYWS
jgi:hypothetical protein